MVREIYEAKDAHDVNELIAWVKKGKSNAEKSARLQRAKHMNFYWSSFRTDCDLKNLNDEINFIESK